jgi:hypothetical protein
VRAGLYVRRYIGIRCTDQAAPTARASASADSTVALGALRVRVQVRRRRLGGGASTAPPSAGEAICAVGGADSS